MAEETELKLHLPDDALAQLERRPLLRNVHAQVQRLEAIYYDTPERHLQRNGLALRLRRSGRRWVQTLKAADVAQSGLSTRREWEGPARVQRGKPRIDLARLRDTPLPALLAEAGHPQLREVFRVKVRRSLRVIEFRRSRIEVAIDVGRIEARRAGRRGDPVAEVELELKAGDVGDLIAAALALVGRGRSALGLVPLLAGKAERGYRLAAGAPAPLAKASAPGFIEHLQSDMSAGAALRAIVGHGLQVLLVNTEAMRSVREIEQVHQARVAIRRMRSAIRLLDHHGDDLPQGPVRELRWIGRLLGQTRDWDVLVAETLPALTAAAPRAVHRDLGRLLARATERRDASRAGTAAALASGRFARLALRLQRWSLSPAPARRPLGKCAAKALDQAHRRLFGAAQFFAALAPERRHRARILAKRLRYALDVFSVDLPERATDEYVRALAELQDVLGVLNDLTVARGALRSIAGGRAASTLVRALIQRREADGIVATERLLLALSERKVPWK
ncbi:MAG TPA: CHAD domain-containing protein [Burkholderiaceae bacterium]|nr:CHAD domain-containing protein [Burkholderiaceae bacterium]